MYLKAAYNTAFGKFDKQDFANMINLWDVIFCEYDFKTVETAVIAYISTNTSQFPPAPAQITEMILKLKESTQEKPLEATEAWALVEKAIRNSSYNAREEFEKLPLLAQRAVGSADCLRTMATDEYFNFSKEKQSFEICYNTLLERQKDDRELQKLPMQIKQAIGIQTTAQERIAAK
jgi:hypothetical protein